MTAESWHSDFNPSTFLRRVNLAQLIERNETYNESATSDAKAPCILCAKTHPRGIVLNDRSFLCQACYSEVALIAYPERYEALRRQFVMTREAHRLAWQGFQARYGYTSQESALVAFGWASVLLAFANPALLVLTAILLAIGYAKNAANNRKVAEWKDRKAQWERSNPVPPEPVLKHFHDPTAELTQRDRQVLAIFNHWPGYPPFWKYLRTVVIGRDSNRCQVTGCPSRLELHVHHMKPVASGGTHTPDNLVSLCDFHHALEPDTGHERIWGDIKTRYFTLVRSHQRSNRAGSGEHLVRAHLRRLQLVTLEELHDLAATYGFCCPNCGAAPITFHLNTDKNIIRIECSACQKASEGAQQLAEETGPRLAEILGVRRNKGRWKARWDMLSERKAATWGSWHGYAVTVKRNRHKDKVKRSKSAPSCPKCGSPMKRVTPRPGAQWEAFWGCTQYWVTGCKGSAPYLPHSDEAGA